jgi:hypothetical protein
LLRQIKTAILFVQIVVPASMKPAGENLLPSNVLAA